jgi:hypothetical protein
MAIKFNCPHCQLAYRLKDEMAGKPARCKNPDCRQLITVPAPATVPPTTPDPSVPARDVEADALSALSDEVARSDATPAAEKVIPVICPYCDHQWTVAWAMGGKNTLCPNPECRQRVKVPEPKEDVPLDWKQQKTKLPSLAKQNFEKLEGVQDAGDVAVVKRTSLEEAGALDEEVEPRPLKDKVKIAVAVGGLIAAVVAGVWYWRSSSVEKGEDRFMAEARAEFDKVAPDMAPAEAGLASAVLLAAEAEHALAHDTPDELKKAQAFFARARDELRRQPPGPVRSAAAGELALAALRFGGTDEQVKEGLRYRWQPDPGAARTGRLNERVHTVHEELRQTLALLAADPKAAPAEFDFKLTVARRLARELARKGQAGFAAELIPLALFGDAEQPEARAAVALEVLPADREVARRTADELKALFGPQVRGNPYPVSAPALFAAVRTEKAPAGPPAPAPAGPVASDPAVLAHVGLLIQDGKGREAVELAGRAVRPETRFKALALCAEQTAAADRALAVDAAVALLAGVKGRKEVAVSPYHLLRLSQLAAESGRPEPARALADGIADEGLRAWAVGDAARLRAWGNPKERADEGWVEVPDDAKKVRAGHAWGRLWVARQNARESGDKGKEKKAALAAPAAARPFALAGIALGLKDR